MLPGSCLTIIAYSSGGTGCTSAATNCSDLIRLVVDMSELHSTTLCLLMYIECTFAPFFGDILACKLMFVVDLPSLP